MSDIEKAIEYVREHIDMERVDIVRGYMYLHRTPLHIEDAVDIVDAYTSDDKDRGFKRQYEIVQL
jgi:hypothetical protein